MPFARHAGTARDVYKRQVLVVLIVILAILMCLVVLIQESKGGGLASSFSASNQIMGVRKTTDVIEKVTWGCLLYTSWFA